MFVAVIHARPDPVRLSATLAPLVRGVVEGLVGSAILVAETSTPDLLDIADSAGCRVLVQPGWSEGFARAVANTGGAPLLLIDTGVMLGQEFWPMLADRLPLLGDRPAATQPVESASPLVGIQRVVAGWRGRVDADSALVLPGSFARAIAHAKADPWRWSFGAQLIRLPMRASRVA